MSVFDCHINRSPIAGRIEKIVYQPGKFLNADLDKASADNERNSLVIATEGARVTVVQIAGLVARRIVCFVHEGQPVGAGERFGMIRFGSRLDVYLPEGAQPMVAVGQTSIAGETVLADLKSAATAGAPSAPAEHSLGAGVARHRIGLSNEERQQPPSAHPCAMMMAEHRQPAAASCRCSSAATGPPSIEPTPCAIYRKP